MIQEGTRQVSSCCLIHTKTQTLTQILLRERCDFVSVEVFLQSPGKQLHLIVMAPPVVSWFIMTCYSRNTGPQKQELTYLTHHDRISLSRPLSLSQHQIPKGGQEVTSRGALTGSADSDCQPSQQPAGTASKCCHALLYFFLLHSRLTLKMTVWLVV